MSPQLRSNPPCSEAQRGGRRGRREGRRERKGSKRRTTRKKTAILFVFFFTFRNTFPFVERWRSYERNQKLDHEKLFSFCSGTSYESKLWIDVSFTQSKKEWKQEPKWGCDSFPGSISLHFLSSSPDSYPVPADSSVAKRAAASLP